MLPRYAISEVEVLPFVLLPVAVAGALVWSTAAAWGAAGASVRGQWRAAGVVAMVLAAWMGLTWNAASVGLLAEWNRRPPAFVVMILVGVGLAGWSAFGPLGRRLAAHAPLWALVAFHAFRLPLELAMHRMAERGIMPPQMSYSGLNFDIVTGLTAIGVALALRAGIAGPRLVLAWNLLGLALLVNVVTIAFLSTPLVGSFGADRLNLWVAHEPFVWLPAVLVMAALAGHLVVFRGLSGRIRRTRRQDY